MKCLSCNDERVKYFPAIKSGGTFAVAQSLKAVTVTGPIWKCVPCNRQFDQQDIDRAARV